VLSKLYASSAEGAPLVERAPARWKSLSFWARLTLGTVFVLASLDKIAYPAAFARIIHNYQILPDPLINLTAIILPWLELIIGLCLICGLWLSGAVAIANLLLAAFFGALLFNIARGLDVECGCFTTQLTGKPTMVWYLVRDGGFLLLGGLLFQRYLFRKEAQ
jgi:uncharacterized membrane protein YphA (DoxX/SURF4 family)